MTKTKKYMNNAHYLGEPCHSTLETVAGNPRNNSTKSFIGQVDVCPPAPNPRMLLASHNINSDVCLPPTASLLTLQHDPKICSCTLLKTFNVTKGDIIEIVASMSSPR